LGATRVYALGFGCALPVTRNRDTEFNASPTSAGHLIERLRRLSGELADTMQMLPSELLDERFLPPVDLWGISPRREISRREALVESIRHAALHLGELRLTRDLILWCDTGKNERSTDS
jgi:hypothetical protein